MRKNFIALCVIFCCSLFAKEAFSHEQIPAKVQSQPIALVNAYIHTITNGDLENATLLFDKGKIVAIGKDLKFLANTKVIDLKGKHIYPSLIAANTAIGLTEISSVRGTIDNQEVGELNPNVKAQIAFNPDSEIIPVTRSNGVLLALSVPSGGLISGISSLMYMDGWTREDMTLKSNVALHLNWPSMDTYEDPKKSLEEQKKEIQKNIKKLSDFFSNAKAYLKAREFEKETNLVNYKTDLKFEAVSAVINKDMPVYIRADKAKQIISAINWCEEMNLKMVLVGGYDSWRVAKLLVEKDIPVIIEDTYKVPYRSWEAYDTPYTLASKLASLGVKYCLATNNSDFSATNTRNLPYQAAMAVSFGLAKEEALKAITIYPAQIMGVANMVGSLEVNKEATLIVTNGNPLEITTNVEMAFIQGKNISLENKHTIFYNKYQQKYKK